MYNQFNLSVAALCNEGAIYRVKYSITKQGIYNEALMKIRPLENNDIPRILEIYNYYITDTTVSFEEAPLTLEAFTARVDSIRKNYPFIVAEENGTVIGYAYLDRFHERSAYRHTADLSIYLDKDCLSKGTGSVLLEHIENLSRRQGITSIISLVTGENIRSIAFHRKHSYREVGIMKNVGIKFNRPLDVFYFQKEL